MISLLPRTLPNCKKGTKLKKKLNLQKIKQRAVIKTEYGLIIGWKNSSSYEEFGGAHSKSRDYNKWENLKEKVKLRNRAVVLWLEQYPMAPRVPGSRSDVKC